MNAQKDLPVDFNIEDSNPTANRSIAQVLDARLSRRSLLRGALGATGAGTLAATGLSNRLRSQAP